MYYENGYLKLNCLLFYQYKKQMQEYQLLVKFKNRFHFIADVKSRFKIA